MCLHEFVRNFCPKDYVLSLATHININLCLLHLQIQTHTYVSAFNYLCFSFYRIKLYKLRQKKINLKETL